MNRLLVVACSQRKNPATGEIPAIERYDGPVFRVLRKYLRETPGGAPTLLILSAKYGLIESSREIPDYDCCLTPALARHLRRSVLDRVRTVLRSRRWDSLGVCVGKRYWDLLDGFLELVPGGMRVDQLGGGLGKRLTCLRGWLRNTARADAPVPID
jgi:hypothetical protein